MDRFIITRDGPGEVREYRSRGVRGAKTGGGWSPVAADAAKWTSAETAEKALAAIKAEYPYDEEGARVEKVEPRRARGTVGETKAEKPAKEPKPAKISTRQRAPRSPKVDKLQRFQCAQCTKVYRNQAQAEQCKCGAAKAIREAGGTTPAKAVRLNGTVEALMPEPEAEATA